MLARRGGSGAGSGAGGGGGGRRQHSELRVVNHMLVRLTALRTQPGGSWRE